MKHISRNVVLLLALFMLSSCAKLLISPQNCVNTAVYGDYLGSGKHIESFSYRRRMIGHSSYNLKVLTKTFLHANGITCGQLKSLEITTMTTWKDILLVFPPFSSKTIHITGKYVTDD